MQTAEQSPCLHVGLVPKRRLVPYFSMCEHLAFDKQLQSLELLDQHGASVSVRESIYHLLRECTVKKDLVMGRRIQALMIRTSLDSIPVLGDHLIRLFAACGSLQDATDAFHRVLKPTIYTWNALISAYIQHGDTEGAFIQYQKIGDAFVKPDPVTFLYILKSCISAGTLMQGQLVYDDIVRNGIESNESVANTLVDLYAKCGNLREAHRIFEGLKKRTVVTWGVIISGYAKHGQGLVAIDLSKKMQQEGIPPDKMIFLGLLRACADIQAIEEGRDVHSQLVSSGIDGDLIAGNALIDMYVKRGSLEEAQNVFNSLPGHSLVSWSTIIAGYAQYGSVSTAFEMYKDMQDSGIEPDTLTHLCILRACNSKECIEKVYYIHEQISDSELKSDVNLLNAVIDSYGRCGNLEAAVEVFHSLQHPNAGSWDALIAGHVLNGDSSGALRLLIRMQDYGHKPSELAFSCALKTCGIKGVGNEVRVLHQMIIEEGGASSSAYENTLVDMYAKCGCLDDAHRVFNRLPSKSAISWSTLISGYVQHGCCLPALSIFQKMRAEGVMPNNVAYSSIVKACGIEAALSEGMLIHEELANIGVETDLVVGSSLVDMYVKCERLDEAQKVFDSLHNRDVVAWAAMVSGYTSHERGVSALDLFSRMQEEGIKPDRVTYLGILKACGSVGIVKQGNYIIDQIIRDSLESDKMIGNMAVDMYVKCGRLQSARKLLNRLTTQTVVAWGSMIGGAAQLGNFELVGLYLDDMQQAGVKPDEVIFTNILAACSHTGRLKEGRHFFLVMKEQHGITPKAEQYSCMIDLLGRGGCFKEVEYYLEGYPGSPDFVTWVSLLGNCKFHGNVELGRECFHQISKLSSSNSSGYVLLSNICSEAQLWQEFDKLQELRRNALAWKKPGVAWIEVDDLVHELVVGGVSHPQDYRIASKLQNLNRALKEEGYWPQLDTVTESYVDEGTIVRGCQDRESNGCDAGG